MKKLKFTRRTTDKYGIEHIEASEGNENGKKKEIAKIKKGNSKPVDPARVKAPDSVWKSNAKIATESYPFTRTPAYANPESLYEAAKDYFIECDNIPYIEQKLSETDKATGSESKLDTITKKQVYTLIGFLNHTGMPTWQWYEHYKATPAYSDCVDFIERTIHDNKYKGAVAGFYNSTVITRDLGLVEKTKDVGKGDDKDEFTIDVEKLSETELDDLLLLFKNYAKVKSGKVIEVD